MPPRRAAMGLIPDHRARAEALTKRTKGLKKKAKELSVLCDVDVALVIAAGAGGEEDKWESRDGVVLARYRALPPETRARHTHRAYLEGVLGKEVATLARVRQAGPVGLRCSDGEMGRLAATEAEARRLLEVLDGAIRAVDERRVALGLPVDDDVGGVLEGIAPLDFVVGGDPGLGGNGGDTDGQVVWGNGGGNFQPCGVADMQLGRYGFQQCTTSSGVGMEGYHLDMAPAMYGSSSSNSHLAYDDTYQLLGHDRQANLARPAWSGDEICHGMVPADDTGLRYNYMVDTQANATSASNLAMGGASGNVIDSSPELSLAMGTGGGNFINAPPPQASALSHPMGGSGDSFIADDATWAQPLAMSFGADLTDAGWYATQWQQQAAPEPQRDGRGREPIQQLHYFSDMEDTQLHL